MDRTNLGALEKIWSNILDFYGNDEFQIYVLGSFLVSISTYWLFGSIYTLVDYLGKPKRLLKYKIQDDSPYPVPSNRLKAVIYQVLFNQTIVAIPFMLTAYAALRLRGTWWRLPLPGPINVLIHLSGFVVIEEVFFYYSHRILHHPKLYKYIHKRHHEWTAPIAITAVYCHPIEHMIANLLPVFMGPLALGSHVAVSWLWYFIATTTTLISHSGYHLPFLPSSEAHDFHHLKFNQNYGMLGILDWLHGTNTGFTKTKAFQRHFTSLSLVPVKELIP